MCEVKRKYRKKEIYWGRAMDWPEMDSLVEKICIEIRRDIQRRYGN